MSTKHLFLILFVLVIAPLIVFISVYQRYAFSTMQRKIAEHAEVIAPSFWNYDPANIEYLTLAAQANHYESIVLEDLTGLTQQSIEGPPPTPLERWLIGVRLVPRYTFHEPIRYNNQDIGDLTVVWRCQTIYTISYVALCLIFLATGITLYIRLLGTKQILLANNRRLQQEIVDRRQAEAALQEAHETLEQRVQDRTHDLSTANRLLNQEVIERERTAKALEESEQKFRDIAKNIPGMVFQAHIRADNSMHFSYISPHASKLFGFPEDLENRKWKIGKRIHPDDRESFFASLSSLTPPGSHWNYEGRLLQEDGSVKWFHGLASSEKTVDGQVANGILLDITPRKELELELAHHRTHLEELVSERTAELSRAKEAALEAKDAAEAAQHKAEAAQRASESANQAKSIFLANMSHELRTPLNAILGFSQLMAREPSINDRQRENLSVINRSGEHLLTLINDVLEMSKIEAGHIGLHLDTCDLWQMLQSIEEMVAVRARSKGLQFIVKRAPEVPCCIRTDESKIRQILVNLLGNAIKFTEQGSVALRINVESSRVVEAWSPGNTSIQGTTPILQHSNTAILYFEVSDTGIGVSADEFESIFETFGRAKQSEQAIEGSGLGLAISRQFAHLMGGEMTLASEIGKGSVFTFILPVEVVQSPERFRPHTARRIVELSPGQPLYRILIVEDTASSREFLRQLLCSTGFIVDEAGNGQEAIEQWEQQRPDFIFMDMHMPVMDGYEATRKIRAAEAATTREARNSKSQIPIIALTANAFEEEQAQILEAGCQEVLRKPVREHIIFETLQSYLGVEYLYAEDDTEQGSGRRVEELPSALLTPEALQTLPPDVLDCLEQAIAQVNVRQVNEAITSVRHHTASIADALAKLAKDFKYQDIWNIIQQVKR